MKLTNKQKLVGGVLTIATAIAGAVVSLGNDRYVNSASGNDANNCSIISPCKTISKGMSLMLPGDVLHLEGDFRQSVTVSKKGTAEKLITITGGRMGCLILSGEYINVDDVEVVDCQSHGVYISGDYIFFSNSKVHGTVMDNSLNGKCTGSGQWGSAVKVFHGGSNIVISGNEVYENCGEGIAATRGTYVTIANNIVYDNFSVDIYIDNSHHVTVENNFTYYTNNTNFYRGGAVGTGIGIASEYYAGWGDQLHDILINNNTIQHAKGIRLYTQVGTKSVPSATITNNTFIQVNSPFVNVPGAIVSNNVAGQISGTSTPTMVRPTSSSTPSRTPTITQPGPSPYISRTPTSSRTPAPTSTRTATRTSTATWTATATSTKTRIPTGTLLYGDFTVTPSRTPTVTAIPISTMTPWPTQCVTLIPFGQNCFDPNYAYPNP